MVGKRDQELIIIIIILFHLLYYFFLHCLVREVFADSILSSLDCSNPCFQCIVPRMLQLVFAN